MKFLFAMLLGYWVRAIHKSFVYQTTKIALKEKTIEALKEYQREEALKKRNVRVVPKADES